MPGPKRVQSEVSDRFCLDPVVVVQGCLVVEERGRKNKVILDMGVDQNYGPFWGLHCSIFLIVQGGKRGP